MDVEENLNENQENGGLILAAPNSPQTERSQPPPIKHSRALLFVPEQPHGTCSGPRAGVVMG